MSNPFENLNTPSEENQFKPSILEEELWLMEEELTKVMKYLNQYQSKEDRKRQLQFKDDVAQRDYDNLITQEASLRSQISNFKKKHDLV